MHKPDNNAPSALLNFMQRRPFMSVVGVIVGLFLLAEIALQFPLRVGWRSYRGMGSVSAIAVDGQGNAWVAGYQKDVASLMMYPENGRSVEVPMPVELTRTAPSALMIDREDRLWVGTEEGMVGMRNASGEWVLYTPEEYGRDSIREMVMDGQGRVWVRSHRGPVRIDPGSGERTIRFTNSGTADSGAAAIAIDPQGQVWVLTRLRKVMTLEANDNWRTVYVAPATVRYGILDAFLAFDPQGQMWLATVQGVGVLSPDGAWEEHPLGDPYSPLSLREVLVDARGRVWVAAWEQGVFLFDPQAGWRDYTSRNSGIGSDANALALDLQGQAWIGSQHGRLSRFNPEAALPAQLISVIGSAGVVVVPAVLLIIALLAMRVTTSVRPSAINRRQIIDFALGFLAWYAVAVLVWGLLRYSSQPSGAVFFYINPLILFVPVVHILLMILLFARARQMARGATAAIVVNSMGLVLMSPLAAGSVGTALLGAILMTPFFLLF